MASAAIMGIASFLPFYSAYSYSTSAWSRALLPLLTSVSLLGVAVGALTALRVLDVALPERVGSFTVAQAQSAAALFVAWTVLGATLSNGPHAYGFWLTLVGAAGLVVGTTLASRIPALALPLANASADPPFNQFWFGVPEVRVVHFAVGASTATAELQPGKWYLATGIDSSGRLIVEMGEGSEAVLADSSRLLRA